jgi:hypothetical protein
MKVTAVMGRKQMNEDDEELQQAQPPTRASRSASAAMVRQGSPSAEYIHDWMKDNVDDVDVDNVDNLDVDEISFGTMPSEEVLEIPGSVWDLVYAVRKDVDNKFWECILCGMKFKGLPNATKAKAHLARAQNAEIKPCVGRRATSQQKDMFKRQWQEYMSKKESKKRKLATDDSVATNRAKRGVDAMALCLGNPTRQRNTEKQLQQLHHLHLLGPSPP